MSRNRLDTGTPSSARIWNYWLGGKDNYAIDRQVGDAVSEKFPSIVRQACEDRRFLGRAVKYLAREERLRQFLDIGTGLPTQDNTHELAQRVAPECRIVYVDNDPLVLVHAQALLISDPAGACDFIDADLRDPGAILARAAETLDFTRPIALMLIGILHHIPDEDDPYGIVARLLDALAPGSFLVVNHATSAIHGAAAEAAADYWNQYGEQSLTLRSPERIARFFTGMRLLEPGIVSCSRWRPDWEPPEEVDEFCGVAQKPER